MGVRKIHIASKTYQRNWAVRDSTFCTNVGEAQGERRNIDSVGYRPHWWGQQPGLADAVENRLSEIEGEATSFLRDPVGHWPAVDGRRAFASVFFALHVVRSPAWRQWHDGQVYHRVAAAIRADPSSDEVEMEVARRLCSDEERVKSTLSQCLKLASLMASMHWSLLRFDGRVLALSDQPVCAIPLSIETGRAPLQAMPDGGFADLLEIRVPVSPSVALILTWYDHPEDEIVHDGTFEQSCSLNASTISQADRHWMRHPDGQALRLRPPTLEPIADPVSPQLLPAYDVAEVLRSGRRQEAIKMVTQMIDAEDRNRVGWVSLESGGQVVA